MGDEDHKQVLPDSHLIDGEEEREFRQGVALEVFPRVRRDICAADYLT